VSVVVSRSVIAAGFVVIVVAVVGTLLARLLSRGNEPVSVTVTVAGRPA
jgi:hypothetical protein